MWICYEIIWKNKPCTNNSVDSLAVWYRAFNLALEVNHVTIWKFITFLKQEQALKEVFTVYTNQKY